MTKKYKVEFDRANCIGAAACEAVNPEKWKVEDGIATLKGAEKNEDNTKQSIEITEKELAKMKEAAEACPVNIIHITDLETGEKII